MRKIGQVCLACLAGLLTGCGEGVPSEQEIRFLCRGLIPEECYIVRHYINYDVDCVIFRFREYDEKDTSRALASFVERAQGEGWEVLRREERVSTFQRMRPGPVFFSLETITTALSDDGWVYVGYIQIDLRDKPAGPMDSLADHGEARWARRFFWPEFNQFYRMREGRDP